MTTVCEVGTAKETADLLRINVNFYGPGKRKKNSFNNLLTCHLQSR